MVILIVAMRYNGTSYIKGSVKSICNMCGNFVLLAPSSVEKCDDNDPNKVAIICNECFLSLPKESLKNFELNISEKQKREIKKTLKNLKDGGY